MVTKTRFVLRDTINFFRNQFFVIFFISLKCSLITIIINRIFLPNKDKIFNLIDGNILLNRTWIFDTIQTMSIENQKTLLHISAASSLSSLFGNTILCSSILLLIQFISSGKSNNLLQIVKNTVLVLPKLSILIFLITLIFQIGIALTIIPGIFLLTILAFSPIILIRKRMSVFSAIKCSIILAYSNMNVIAPIIIIWLFSKIFLLFSASYFLFFLTKIGFITMNVLNNIITSLLLIYLTRLYMLICK